MITQNFHFINQTLSLKLKVHFTEKGFKSRGLVQKKAS